MSDSKDAQTEKATIVTWIDSLSVGIEELDNQHKHLINLTNKLYRACKIGDNTLDAEFKETMNRMANYVRSHFAAEQKLFTEISYPKYMEHKKEHDNMVYKIIKTLKEYEGNKDFIPMDFVVFLKNWIVDHVASSDHEYGAYYRTWRIKNKKYN